MKLVDLHCDTIMKMIDEKSNLMENNLCISIPALKKADSLAQFFACFTYLPDYPEEGYDGAYRQVQKMLDFVEEQEKIFSQEISIVKSYEDILENKTEAKISAILTVEEGGVINGKMERLEQLYKRGIRLITPMWNFENCLGHPNSRNAEDMKKGMKPFGKEVLERMGELGMIIDVSHASDGSFWDMIDMAKCPIVASHSNCRKLCSHPRNLSDDMIRALAERGGVSGLNFYGAFLGTADESRVDEMAAHVLHMIKIGGENFPAIGTDFDGFDGAKKLDIPTIGEMELLWNELKKKGIFESQLDKIWNGNALRILKNI